jgi:hypothetical protein
MIIKRTIQEQMEKDLFKGKILVLYGARQVGKTTLVKEILKNYPENSVYLTADDPQVRNAFTDVSIKELETTLAGRRLIVLDEAQRIKNIGITLKLAVDTFPNTQIIATGSSSFDLSNQIMEPLTGRVYEFHLYPFSAEEINFLYNPIEMKTLYQERMIYGMYPSVVLRKEEAVETLSTLAGGYLYKDVLAFDHIRRSDIIEKLLQSLALQIGQEVSFNELARALGISRQTVENYVRILEQAFIIFRLQPLSRNLRKEIHKMRKIYFYDLGVRNALIGNLNPIDTRQDVGALWENFLVTERMKYLGNRGEKPLRYFWRTKDQQEIDYLEDSGGEIHGFEFKWGDKKAKLPKIFSEAYKGSTLETINRDTFSKFIGI